MNKNAKVEMLIPGEAEAGDVLRFPGRTGGHAATLTAVLGFFSQNPSVECQGLHVHQEQNHPAVPGAHLHRPEGQ